MAESGHGNTFGSQAHAQVQRTRCEPPPSDRDARPPAHPPNQGRCAGIVAARARSQIAAARHDATRESQRRSVGNAATVETCAVHTDTHYEYSLRSPWPFLTVFVWWVHAKTSRRPVEGRSVGPPSAMTNELSGPCSGSAPAGGTCPSRRRCAALKPAMTSDRHPDGRTSSSRNRMIEPGPRRVARLHTSPTTADIEKGFHFDQ